MKQYIIVKLTSLPRYFAGSVTQTEHNINFDIEWSIHKSMATKLTYEEADYFITYYQQYISARMQIIDTCLDHRFV